MTAYFAARFAVKDANLLADYSKQAAPIIASFGGKLLFKGGADTILTGDTQMPGIAVFEFPSQAKLDEFYNSPAYVALKPAREAGADMILSGHAA